MPNRLALETSPYLQQHADNPVDWYAWGEEALSRARREGKPILLSIGYSACHWCHVMAHESFEDPQVASVMNRLYVNVKVDREERPDLDHIYQLAHQMLAQRAGGWPLTVFLTPEQVPFYAGTYFPRQPRYGMPGFVEILERVAQVWDSQRADIEQQNTALLAALERESRAATVAGLLSPSLLDAALEALKSNFDAQNGGFGGAPKFPHPAELEFCLRRSAATADADAQRLVLFTLEKMAKGGIYDQLGGGFARYSTDAHWTIPHFEKMLYDNGPLLRLYADAWCVTGDALFARVVEDTAAWLMREMQSPGGGYYSSLDADSEGEEGKYYVWDRAEVRSLLTPEEDALVEQHYGLDRAPNFEARHWHLAVTRPLEEAHRALLDAARAKLLAARERRVRPGRDDKILTSWNALAILGMARAGSVFGRGEWIDSARRAFAFVHEVLWKDGALLATCKDGRAHLNAYLDDHAYLLRAAIGLLECGHDARTLDFARQLADALLGKFEDRSAGGFYFTGHDHEALIARMKTFPDGATPSGNGVAALALARLSFICGDERYREASERALNAAASGMHDAPSAHASMLMALEEHLVPPRTIVLRGPHGELDAWRSRMARLYLPHSVTLPVPAHAAHVPPAIDKPVAAGVNAWVCEGVSCLAPVDDLGELVRLVSKPSPGV